MKTEERADFLKTYRASFEQSLVTDQVSISPAVILLDDLSLTLGAKAKGNAQAETGTQ